MSSDAPDPSRFSFTSRQHISQHAPTFSATVHLSIWLENIARIIVQQFVTATRCNFLFLWWPITHLLIGESNVIAVVLPSSCSHQTYHSVSVFSLLVYNFNLASCISPSALAWREWKWLWQREREKKDRGNTEEMTTTQSAMLLRIVWVDFPTQQGHRGWGPLFSAPLSEHLHSLSHYFPHPPPRLLLKI